MKRNKFNKKAQEEKSDILSSAFFNKKAQEEKSDILSSAFFNKKAQEEMTGFIIIVVLVMIILVVFLSFSLNKNDKDTIESYEVKSFLDSCLQYTPGCSYGGTYLDIQNMIYKCGVSNSSCNCDGKENNSCKVLDKELKGILNESWGMKTGKGKNFRYKGYEFVVLINNSNGPLINISKGNITFNSKGAKQNLPEKQGKKPLIIFKAYY